MTETANAAAEADQSTLVPRSAETVFKDGVRGSDLTPAGVQNRKALTRRRVAMATICALTYGAIMYAVATLLGGSSWSVLDVIIVACVAISAPWTVLGFWNAAIGLWLLAVAKDPLKRVSPFLPAAASTAPIRSRVAVFMTIRNEDPERAFQRLIAMRHSLDATGQGDAFDFFVLSDTTVPEVAEREEALFEANQDRLGGIDRAQYRRREINTGFKAGNVRDFLERWGDNYDLMLPLDADSVMSGETIVQMTRIAEQNPKIGILQSLAIGAPAESPFARVFQFGMRHGMRSFTMGSAWWQGDCGPFWGHNAIVRVAPFKAHCELPVLSGQPPLGGHILSHDQLEAAFMRRAGYEVRVIPVEGESWEDNPVTLLDFMKREQRWCNGNMQYWPLLTTKGLTPTSRFQLLQAILMYLAPPAWMLMTFFAALKVYETSTGYFNETLAVSLFIVMFLMSMAPKLAGVIDVALQPGGMRRYGGPLRFLASTLTETVFSMLMAPAMALRLAIFMVGLAFGYRITWSGQVRDAYGLEWSTAWRGLWPQTLFGLLIAGILASEQPAVLPWAAPILLGLIFAPLFAVVTASPRFGVWLWRVGLATIPEEVRANAMLRRVDATIPSPPVTSYAAQSASRMAAE